jgi:thioredoxin reductase (NADPH)
VTLSYRREEFSRIKERNAQRIAAGAKSGKPHVIFNSQPVEIMPKAVRLEIVGATKEIPNDYVWVFAGGTPPREFLEKIGIGIGPRDLTAEARTEAKLVRRRA